VEYRDFEPKDSKLFLELANKIFPRESHIQPDFNQILNEKKGFFIYSKLNEQIVGYAIITRTGEKTGHLQHIGVDPAFQGKGFGNKLMEIALEKFFELDIDKKITLYVEKENSTAIQLYKKHSFIIHGQSWHFIAPWSKIGQINHSYKCTRVQLEHLQELIKQFELEEINIKKHLEHPDRIQLMLKKENNGELIGYCMFTPSFPGCMPFILKDIQAFDTFARNIQEYSLPEFDHIRFTFDDNEELTTLMSERGYQIHHSLYKMKRKKNKDTN
jgi:ribosomal protein S18 acetylase RimI-like enzyme